MKKLLPITIVILSLNIFSGCTSLKESNNYGFFPNQEDGIGWEYQSRENILNSQDGSYRKNNGSIIWSSNPR